MNTFLHVNHQPGAPRYGDPALLERDRKPNRWLKQNLMAEAVTYDEMNRLAAAVPAGAEGLMIFPYGNGAERTLENKELNASIQGLNFNLHHQGHLLRAGQEGIVFALNYGLGIMKQMGVKINFSPGRSSQHVLKPVVWRSFCHRDRGAGGNCIIPTAPRGRPGVPVWVRGFMGRQRKPLPGSKQKRRSNPILSWSPVYQELYENGRRFYKPS